MRKKKGLTQKDLSAALGVSQGHISSIEKNEKSPGSEILISLKQCFDVDLNWLLVGGDEDYSPNETVTQIDPPEIADLIEGARKVLTSGNPIAFDALERNIRYFSHAIDVEKRMQVVEAELAEMKRYVLQLKRREEERNETRLGEQSSERKVA